MSEKDGETRFRYLVGACLDNTSISDYCVDHRAVSADTILKLGHRSLEEMTVKCNRLLTVSARMALRGGRFKGSDLSFDYHDVVYHGERQESTLKVLVKGRLRRCHRYAVASLTGNKRFAALSIQPYLEGEGNLNVVDRLLQDSPLDYNQVLMDRFFCGVDVFERIEGWRGHYITPYKKNKTIDRLYMENPVEQVVPYGVRKHGTKKTKQVYLYLVPHPKDRYHAYVSDLPGQTISEHYPHRWNIENLFKTKNTVKPVTSTTSESFRILLMTIALILASLWKLLVRTIQHIPVKKYKKQLYQALQEHTLLENMEDTPTTL